MKTTFFALLMVLAVPAAAQNLLVNPDFDLDPTNPANGWAVEGTGEFLWNQADGDPAPPSARTNQAAGESMILYQCVGIVGGTGYDFSSRSFTHSSIGTATNGVQLSVYSSTDCTGVALETTPTDQTTFPSWALRERNGYVPPAGANSARIELFSTANDDQNQISWDNVMVVGQAPAQFSGEKFEDLDTDGIRDAGEPPLEGWNIHLLQWVDDAWVHVDTDTFTDVAGAYVFDGLAPGETYAVCEVAQAGWVQSLPADPGGDGLLDCGAIAPIHAPVGYQFTPGPGEVIGDNDFGNYQLASVTACKLRDVDNIPGTEADREPLPGWTVQLTLDGVVLDEQVTGGDGCYTWEGLEPLTGIGIYGVAEVLPDGWFALTDTTFLCDTLFSGDACSFTFVNMLVKPIPTLGFRALVLMALLLGGFGLYRARRQTL